MAVAVNDLTLDLKIGGIEYPVTAGEINRISLHSSTRFPLPMAQIVLPDVQNVLNSTIPITHGMSIVLSISDNETSATDVYKLRLFDIKETTDSSVRTYDMTCYYDAPEFIFGRYTGAIRGTSSYVMRSLAEASGLGYEGDQTNDRQIWYPGNRRMFALARYAERHAYRGEVSLMRFGVRLDGTLTYRDYYAVPDRDVVFSLRVPDVPGRTVYVADTFSQLASAGYFNAYTGYSHTLVYNDAVRGGTPDNPPLFSSITKKNLSRKPMHNRMVTKGRLDFSYIDPGMSGEQVHPNFFRAEYSNLRASMLQNTGLEIVTRDRTSLDIMDKVRCIMSHREFGLADYGLIEDTENPADGTYIVTNKTIFLSNNRYAEKFHVLSDGID